MPTPSTSGSWIELSLVVECFYGSNSRNHNWMISGVFYDCQTWPSCGWYCHGEGLRSLWNASCTFGDSFENIWMLIHMYPSEYECVNRWKLKHILKYGSRWITPKCWVWQNPYTSMVFKLTFGELNNYMYLMRVLTVESWNTFLGVNNYDFYQCNKWITAGEDSLQVILITPRVVLEQVFTQVITAPSYRNNLLYVRSQRRQEALGSRS